MKSRWDDAQAAAFPGDLGPRIYTSRLLGSEPALVLHGGGNTSVKLSVASDEAEPVEILYVKASGSDLATIDAAGFAPLRLAAVRRLARRERLSDPEMVNALLCERIRAEAPTPSVETLLHAVLPYAYVDHTHADAVVTISNTPGGDRRIAEIYGADVVVVPYAMPGFDLARRAARCWDTHGDGTLGMVLLGHGVFSFGDTARVAYERMVDLVTRADPGPPASRCRRSRPCDETSRGRLARP
jgi:rhamnose utilization protein RhaD (predicted bifunctional aldolase and dehydrogenase)